MAAIPRDDEREERITDEIIVDCYGPEEQAMGWYCSFAKLGKRKMGFDLGQTLPLCDLLDHPGDRFAQGLAEHGATGLADGRQAYMSPFLRTVMP